MFGITPSFGLEIAILFVSALLAGVTVYLGLKKGIKRLSDINVVIALAMVAYGALVGPTSSLFDIFTNAVGKMLGNFWNMTFWTNPFSEGSFPRDWTIFYALFWAGYGPFMGLFIARISRGRTVREVIGWGMFGHGGGRLHDPRRVRLLYPVGAIPRHHRRRIHPQDAGRAAAMMAVIDTLPFSKVVMLIYCAFSTIFLATTVNSGCYVVAATATRRMPVDADPHRYHCTFWAVAQGLLALGLLAMGRP